MTKATNKVGSKRAHAGNSSAFPSTSASHRLNHHFDIRRVLGETFIKPFHAALIGFVQFEIETSKKDCQTGTYLEVS